MKRFGFALLVLVALVFAAQVVSAQEGGPDCPWGYAYNPMTNDFVQVCIGEPTTAVKAASKPVGLAAVPASIAESDRSVRCLSFAAGPTYEACMAASAASVAAKPAGLAQQAPAVTEHKSVPCAVWMASSPEAAALLCVQ